MKTVEKVAYLKGLAEGLNLNSDKPETKMFNAIMEVLKELAESHDDLEESLDLVAAQLDEVDHDLGQLEELILGECECDDEECECGCESEHEHEHKAPEAPAAREPEPEPAPAPVPALMPEPEPEEDETEYYEVECPSCHEIICVDEGILEEGSVECPSCGEKLEFEIEFE